MTLRSKLPPRNNLVLVHALTVVALFASCESSNSQPAEVSGRQPDLSTSKPTTSGDVAVRNLDSRIGALRELIALQPRTLAYRTQLVGLLLDRAQFLGNAEDTFAAHEFANEAVAEFSEHKDSHLALAQVLSALHRFDEAAVVRRNAEALGATPSAETLLLAELAQPQRTDDLASIEAEARAQATVSSLAALAGVYAARGEFDEADHLYREAAANYRDVSPFVIAWLEFTRGKMWGESANDPYGARVLYQEAVRRLPDYVVANVHLAEIEWAEGEPDLALERLERVAKKTGDPEPSALAAELLLESGDSRAQTYAAFAGRRYDELLKQAPLAYADHGAEFFFSPIGDDPVRALALATLNLNNRKTARAYEIMLEAAHAAGEPELLCETAEAAAGLSARNENLATTLEELAVGCSGD